MRVQIQRRVFVCGCVVSRCMHVCACVPACVRARVCAGVYTEDEEDERRIALVVKPIYSGMILNTLLNTPLQGLGRSFDF